MVLSLIFHEYYESVKQYQTVWIQIRLDVLMGFFQPDLGASCLQRFISRLHKSSAGMQHTPPGDIFNAKKIILKLDLFMQSLKKICKEMPKIESEKPIYNVNQGP